MKRSISILTTLLALCFTLGVAAQVKNVENETKRQGTNRINKKIDKGIDSGFDAIEDGIGSLFGKKKKKKKKNGEAEVVQANMENTGESYFGGGANSIAGQDPEALFQQYGMYPPDGSTDVPMPVTLKWTPMNGNGFKAASYELYLEESETNPMKMLGGTRSNKKECKNLKPNTTYSWSYKGKSSGGQYMPGGGGTFTTGEAGPAKMDVQWSKFDFVPGDEVIFEDGPDIMEENGEFPSRWDLVKGQTEIANVNGENVIMFIDGSPAIIPYIENSKEDYLPEVFTIEFDFFRPSNGNRFSVYLSDLKNQKHGQEIEISYARITVDDEDVVGMHPERNSNEWNEKAFWTHVSIAFTKGKLKIYLDDTRVVNIPRYQQNPTGLTLQAYWAELADNKAFYVKNVRIAKGGVKYYDRVLSDGKIIVNGIRFDVNKATIKPESNGAINKIFQLMQKQPDLKFSVEGHTDSDGDANKNQTLSEQRGKAVMDRLISMGISANRLKSTGFGESKPIGENGTPEGKANNRRVEFVKFSGNTVSTSSSSVGSSTGNSAFDSLDRKSIAKKIEALPEQINIPVSNNNGLVNGAGTVILYATSDGNLGKMEILDVDKNNGYKLTTRFVTYNYNGSVHSQSNNLEIKGTYTCDLDKGITGGDVYSENDFHLGKQDSKTSTIYPGETAILRVLK